MGFVPDIGLGCSKACVSLLVSVAGYKGGWLRGPRCLRAGVGLLVGRAASCHGSLQICSGLGAGVPLMVGGWYPMGPEAGACSLVCEAGPEARTSHC